MLAVAVCKVHLALSHRFHRGVLLGGGLLKLFFQPRFQLESVLFEAGFQGSNALRQTAIMILQLGFQLAQHLFLLFRRCIKLGFQSFHIA